MQSTDSPPQSGCRYLASSTADKASLSPNQQLMPLTATVNEQDHLTIGNCDVTQLVEQYASPLYIVDELTLRTACRQYRDAFKRYYPGESQVIYASKAWCCLAISSIIASESLGFDVVSGGELYTVLRALELAGAKTDWAKEIYFHGNNKSKAELKLALEVGCTIIVDNWLELELLKALTTEYQALSANILLRMTPGIECHTHEYIRTGHLDSKFGFDPTQLDSVLNNLNHYPSLNCLGLHAHIGSQIFEQEPHQDLGPVLIDWLAKADHYGLSFSTINIGGGLGIRYTEFDDPPSIEDWCKASAQAVVRACESRQLPLPKLIAEPGRSLIGTACVTAYSIGSRKTVPGIRTYLSVDGGMSDNPRPITYQSDYCSVIANRMSATLEETVTLAGKHCESGDVLIKDLPLPKTEAGDILVVLGTGAYNHSMASNYNRLPRPAAVLVNKGEANLILARENYDDLIRQDRLPERLKL